MEQQECCTKCNQEAVCCRMQQAGIQEAIRQLRQLRLDTSFDEPEKIVNSVLVLIEQSLKSNTCKPNEYLLRRVSAFQAEFKLLQSWIPQYAILQPLIAELEAFLNP